ncbi:MAG: hypothetical protein ACJAUY_001007 [Cognaticolwellia sp.]|jgi:hypothetical protein
MEKVYGEGIGSIVNKSKELMGKAICTNAAR